MIWRNRNQVKKLSIKMLCLVVVITATLGGIPADMVLAGRGGGGQPEVSYTRPMSEAPSMEEYDRITSMDKEGSDIVIDSDGEGAMTWYIDQENKSRGWEVGIVVKGSDTVAHIFLDGVNINRGYGYENHSCIKVEDGATAYIYIIGDTTLSAFDYSAAIQKDEEDGYVGVFAKENCTLIATGGDRGAGIGGNMVKDIWDEYNGHDIKNLIIGDDSWTGTIKATGGTHAAGIGSSEGGNVEGIHINGGMVIAKGGLGGAGIGGGWEGSAKNIEILSGTVETEGGAWGAGIGTGGWYWDSSKSVDEQGEGGIAEDICIKDGNVVVKYAGNSASGIGGGERGGCKNVSIEGGKLSIETTSGGVGPDGQCAIGSGAGGITNENIKVVVGNSSYADYTLVGTDINESYHIAENTTEDLTSIIKNHQVGNITLEIKECQHSVVNYSYDSDAHWCTCGCGFVIAEREAHSGEWNTTTHKKVCSKCGYEMVSDEEEPIVEPVGCTVACDEAYDEAGKMFYQHVVYGDFTFKVRDDSGIKSIKYQSMEEGRVVDKDIPVEQSNSIYTINADNTNKYMEITDIAGNVLKYYISIQKQYNLDIYLNGVLEDTALVNHLADIDIELPSSIQNYNYYTVSQGQTLLTPNAQGKYEIHNITNNIRVDIFAILDETSPDVTVSLDSHTWTNINKGTDKSLYYGETKQVEIEAQESETPHSGVKNTYYCLSPEPIATEDLSGLSGWIPYEDKITLEENSAQYVYVKSEDIAGNVTYMYTDRVVIDTIHPEISGVEQNETYYGDTAVTVTDRNLSSVVMDGKSVDVTKGTYLIHADNKEHEVEATDWAGNKTTYRFTLMQIHKVTFNVDGKIVDQKTVKHGMGVTDVPKIPKKTGYDQTAPHWSITDFSNITSDLTVNAVYTANRYTIEVPQGPDYTIVLPEDNEVEYGDTYSFEVEPDKDIGKDKEIVVTVNGQIIKPDAKGVYTVSNITDIQQIQVQIVDKETPQSPTDPGEGKGNQEQTPDSEASNPSPATGDEGTAGILITFVISGLMLVIAGWERYHFQNRDKRK